MRKLQGTHPVRKVLHMQKCYPETVIRLNNKGNDGGNKAASSPAARLISSRWLRNPSPNNKNTSPHSSSVQTCRGTQDDGHGMSGDATRRRIADEHQFCRNKMAYNRTKGRCVDQVGFYMSLYLQTPVTSLGSLFSPLCV